MVFIKSLHNNLIKSCQYQQKMGVWKHLKDGLQKCDFFCSTEYLRYKKEPEYRTVLGGFTSIFLIGTLLVVFSNKVINTLNMRSITSSTSIENVDDPLPVVMSTAGQTRREFMFGVEIWHHNLNEGIRYFDINFKNMEFTYGEATNNSVQYPLQPCTFDHWKGYPLIQDKFEELNMRYWLCPPKDTDFTISGKYSSQISKTMEVSVNKCTNSSFSSRRCADQDELRDFFANFTNKMYFTIYFTNPRINPEQAEYISYFLEDQNYIIFSQTGGEEAQIMVDDFTIETDDSISPFPLMITKQGSIVQKTAIKNRFEKSADNDNYCTFYFYKSANSLQITRSYQKLDEILSYIGGLFGTIALCLFFLPIYNGYSFEIHLGGILYSHDEEKDGFKKYNFLHFLTQGFYNLLRIFGGGNCLTRAKGYQRCRTELLKQLDVLYLLKRVSFLERAINVILDEHQIKAIHLLKKLSLQDARKYRKNFKLHQKVVEEGQNIQYNRKDSHTTANLSNQPLFRQNSVQNEDNFQVTGADLPNGVLQISQPSIFPTGFDDDQSSSDEQGDQNENQQTTFEQLLRLKDQKDVSPVNERIYKNLSDPIKQLIEKFDIKYRTMEDKTRNMHDSNLNIVDFKPKRRYEVGSKDEKFTLMKLLKSVEVKETSKKEASKDEGSSVKEEDNFVYLTDH